MGGDLRTLRVLGFAAMLAFSAALLGSATPAICADSILVSPPEAAVHNLPRGDVDNSTCVSCHKVQVKSFRETMMGHLMMGSPRDQQEAMACQSCHGPGREHLRHPHKPSPGFMSFRETTLTDIKIENERCLECHANGARAFWRASTHAFRGIRCVDCHAVMCPVTATALADAQLKR
ncbi:MAG TPA: hypothetical protein VMT58_08970, partial [Candidatus Binataceae bacterium]|nr:hypothetical protein [Candidatus Binataceae bacterium]